jgi:hypothetical protein
LVSRRSAGTPGCGSSPSATGSTSPNDDDWLKIQFQFLINEMPVTDASRKVKAVVQRRQQDGKWICAAPYGLHRQPSPAV